MGWAVNKCGGKRWHELPNGLIEVEGEGVPMVDPDDSRFAYMEQTWSNWEPYFREASATSRVPLSRLLAIASIETGYVSHNPAYQASIVSPAGAQGVMQIMPATASMLGLNPSERDDPRLNILAGAKFIRQLMDGATGEEFAHIGSAYNAGPGSGSSGVRCQTGRNEWNMIADHNYPRQIIEFNNGAITYLGLGRGLTTSRMVGVGLGIAGLGVAALIISGKARPLGRAMGIRL